MGKFVKTINTDYYGTYRMYMNNVPNRVNIKVVNGSSIIYETVPWQPGGSWMNACVEIPVFPGKNVVTIDNYKELVWRGKNYTRVSFSSGLKYENAVKKDLRSVCKISGSYIYCNINAILVPYAKFDVWGGYPNYNPGCSPYATYGNFLIRAPKNIKILRSVGYNIRSVNLITGLDFNKSYAIVPVETVKKEPTKKTSTPSKPSKPEEPVKKQETVKKEPVEGSDIYKVLGLITIPAAIIILAIVGRRI